MATAELEARPRAAALRGLARAWAAVRAEPLLIGLVALAAVLRFATIDQQSYWLDEAFTVGLLREDFPDMLRLHDRDGGDAAALLRPRLAVGAASSAPARSGCGRSRPLVGTATVPVMFAAGKELVSRRAGLIAAALTATSPLMIWYSQEARAYALLVSSALRRSTSSPAS